eukprot:TRINITY_DN2297_c0_g1_i10.p1 TRINITY_DN2297_c0_g1~~TRINITY_DN2297_c0_g1_i10.p1  ORF type:complete len:250 (-),score=60.84 TRINITY_DN2297_c0_g1_i10:118-867(-)
MVAAFPVAKLGFLLVKQVSKPIAKSIAARARNSKFFRTYVCIPVAQLFHWYEIRLKMRMLNIGGKVTKVPKLNEAKAIEQGSEILSEFIILSIAATILIYEYNRSKEKEEAKELAKEQETERIKNKIFELEFKQDKQTTQIRELSKLVIELKEHEHKRSLKRIFAAHPEVSPEIISSAQEEDTNVESTSETFPAKSEQDLAGNQLTEQNAPNQLTKENQLTEEKTPPTQMPKKGEILAAVEDILGPQQK